MQLEITNSMEQDPSLKANIIQLVEKFPAFYGNRRVVAVFTAARFC
jgi:hypothetical protein